MVVRDKTVVPADNVEEILDMVPRIKELADIKFEILDNKDSTNIVPRDWTVLTNFIVKNMDNYDGFIVTHGTNTMSYTASALSLALGAGLKKPVVLTGSQLPLTSYGDDARNNLEYAVKTVVQAVEESIAQVMIVFGDVVLSGSRSVKVSEDAFRAFESPSIDPIGKITARGIKFGSHARRINPDIEFKVNPYFQDGVQTLDLDPGNSPQMIIPILSSGVCTGLILRSHGAGSVPNVGDFSFISLIKLSVEKYLIPVIVATKFLGGNAHKDTNDEPAVQAIEAGAIIAGDTTDVMTAVKFMWLLAQGYRDREKLELAFRTDFVGEVTPF